MYSPFRPQTLHRAQSSVNYHHVEKLAHESQYSPHSGSRDTGTTHKWLLVIEYGGELLPAGQEEGRGSVLAILRPTAHQQLVHLIQDPHLPSPLGLHLLLALPDLTVAPSISESVWQHLFAPHFHTTPTLSTEQHHPSQTFGGLPIAARLFLRLDKHQARWYESWRRDPLDGLVGKWVNLAGVPSVQARQRDGTGLKSATDDSVPEDTRKEHRPQRPKVDTSASPTPVVATSSPPRPRRSPLRPSPPPSVISQRTPQREVEPEGLHHAALGLSLESQTISPPSPTCPSADSLRQLQESLDFPISPLPHTQQAPVSPISIMSLHPCSAEPWTPHTPHNDPTRWPYPGLDSPSPAPLWSARSVATSWGPPTGGSLPSPLDPLGPKDWIRTPDLADRSRFSVPNTPRSSPPPSPPPSHGHDTVPPPPIRPTPWTLVWPFFTAVKLPAASPIPHGSFPGHNHPSEPRPPVPIPSTDFAPSADHGRTPGNSLQPHSDPAPAHHDTPPRPARTPSTFVPFEEIAFSDTPDISLAPLAPRPTPAPFKLAPPPAKRGLPPRPISRSLQLSTLSDDFSETQAGFSTTNVRESHHGDISPDDTSPRPFSNLGPTVNLAPVSHEPPPPPPAPTSRGLLRRFSLRKSKPPAPQSISEAQDQGQYQSSSARQSSVSLASASKEPNRPLKRVSQTMGFFSEGGVDSGPPLNSPRASQGTTSSLIWSTVRKGYPIIEIYPRRVGGLHCTEAMPDLTIKVHRAEYPHLEIYSPRAIFSRDTSPKRGYPHLVIYPRMNTRSPAAPTPDNRDRDGQTRLPRYRPVPANGDRYLAPFIAKSLAHIPILLTCFNYPHLVIYPSSAGPTEVPSSVKTCFTPPRKSTGKCFINDLGHLVDHAPAAASINVLLCRANYPHITIYPFKLAPLVILLSSYQYPDITIYPAVDRRRLDRPVQSDAPREIPSRPARPIHQLEDLITYDLPHRAGHGRATSTSSLPSTVLSTPIAGSPRSPPPLPIKSLHGELTRSTRATMFDLDHETDSVTAVRPLGGPVATTSAKSPPLGLARNRSSTLVSERTRALFGDHHGEPSVVSPAVRVSRSRTITSTSRPSDVPTDQPPPGSHTRGRSVGKLPATMMRNWI